MIVDTNEKKLIKQAAQFVNLREQLHGSMPPCKIDKSKKDRVIAAVASITGRVPKLPEIALGSPEEQEVFLKYWNKARWAGTSDWEPGKVERFNRLHLQALLPGLILDRTAVKRPVLIREDQAQRLIYFGTFLAAFLLASVLVDANASSLHAYYRKKLRRTYLIDDDDDDDRPGPGLSKELATTQYGAPYHLIGATQTAVGRQGMDDEDRRRPFLFSRHFCGIESDGIRQGEYQQTEEYQRRSWLRLDLATAMAVSGAAVSPIATTNRPLFWLMMLLNLRLGQWFPRPSVEPSRGARWYVNPAMLMFDHFRRVGWRYCFLSDGGQYENLGLEQLLRRRCRLVIVSDAGQDQSSVFEDFTRLLRRLRVNYGIRLFNLDDDRTVQLDALLPDPTTRRSRRNHVIARICYPGAEPSEGLLVYLKPTLTGQEDVDLRLYRDTHPVFPHDATTEQFYDDTKIESYRHLGYHVATEAVRSLSKLVCEPGGPPGLTDRIRKVLRVQVPPPSAGEGPGQAPDSNQRFDVQHSPSSVGPHSSAKNPSEMPVPGPDPFVE